MYVFHRKSGFCLKWMVHNICVLLERFTFRSAWMDLKFIVDNFTCTAFLTVLINCDFTNDRYKWRDKNDNKECVVTLIMLKEHVTFNLCCITQLLLYEILQTRNLTHTCVNKPQEHFDTGNIFSAKYRETNMVHGLSL